MRSQRDLQRQVKAAKIAGDGTDGAASEATELQRSEDAEKVALKIGGSLAASGKARLVPKASVFGDSEAGGSSGGGDGGASASAVGGGSAAGASGVGGVAAAAPGKRPVSAIESLMREEKAKKERAEAAAAAAAASASASAAAAADGRSDYWLAEGIIVKVVNKRLAEGGYYKRKGVVEKVAGKYTAHVRMNDSGDLLKLDQDDLETVIPDLGKRVLVVNGRWRGEVARVLAMDQERFCVAVELVGGPDAGRKLDRMEYEDVCKLHR